MLGVVLAGGEGRRMGMDKAMLAVGAGPLWRRQVRVLHASGASRVIVARRRSQPDLGYGDCRFDLHSDAGPISGLMSALAVGGHAFVAVLAVDMPGIDPAWFLWLRGFCRPGSGAVARHAASVEPLAAIYPRECRSEVEGRVCRGETSVRQLALCLAGAGRMTVVAVPSRYFGRLASLNAPA